MNNLLQILKFHYSFHGFYACLGFLRIWIKTKLLHTEEKRRKVFLSLVDPLVEEVMKKGGEVRHLMFVKLLLQVRLEGNCLVNEEVGDLAAKRFARKIHWRISNQ